jgi:hypothetical protein
MVLATWLTIVDRPDLPVDNHKQCLDRQALRDSAGNFRRIYPDAVFCFSNAT